MHVYGELTGILSAPVTISGTLSSPQTLSGELTIPQAILPPTYEGSYEVTPTNETQTLTVDHLYMVHDITINPIPDNYGLITWNGSTLTVS